MTLRPRPHPASGIALQRAACDVCGAALGPRAQRWQLSDGRVACAGCHATAIYDPAAARRVYAEMIAVAQDQLGLTLNVPTALTLVDQNQLAEILRQQPATALLDPTRTLGIYARKGLRRGIYAQTGLPRLLLLQVAAHEYGHAWQGENCPLLRSPLAREGFAEWVAYKTLAAGNHAQPLARMQTRADIYGEGLRWALAIEKQFGLAGLKDRCRRMR